MHSFSLHKNDYDVARFVLCCKIEIAMTKISRMRFVDKLKPVLRPPFSVLFWLCHQARSFCNTGLKVSFLQDDIFATFFGYHDKIPFSNDGSKILAMSVSANDKQAESECTAMKLGYFFHGLYYFAVSPIFFHKRTILLPWFTGSAAAVNIGLNFLLIPHLGIVGAALATTISMLFQAVVVYLFGKRLHDHGFKLLATAVISLVMTMSFIGPLCVEDTLSSQALRTGCFLLLLITVYTFFKQDLENILLAIRRQYRT